MTQHPSNLNPVTPTCSASGVNATTDSASPSVCPVSVVAAQFESALAPAMAADAATAPDLSDPPVAVAVSGALDFEAEVSALEARWLRAGIIMNSSAFRVAAASEMKSGSSA